VKENQDMLFIAAAAVVSSVIILALMRARRSRGLDYLGVVSERWIAEQRGSSYDVPR
jgi:hypothetical protein